MDTDEYKIDFIHFRVPAVAEILPKSMRGKPEVMMLIHYMRSSGWFDKSSGMHGHLWKHIKPLPRGGMTKCTIFSKEEEGVVLAVGRAMCSFSDNFNYKRGREIALGRARAELERSMK